MIWFSICWANLNSELATYKKFSRGLIAQTFFGIVIDPNFDKSDFFRGRFCGSFRQPPSDKPIVILVRASFPRGIRVSVVDMFLRKHF